MRVGALVLLSMSFAPTAWAQASGQAGTSTAAEVIPVRAKRVSREAAVARRAAALDVVDLAGARDVALDMGEVLRSTRGIILRQNGGLGSRTTFSLNGLSGQQVPIFLDGLPIELSGFASNIAAVPPGLIDRIDIHKGVVPIELGADALGGAIDLKTRPVFDTRAFASYEHASFGIQRALADLGWASDDAAFHASGQVWLDQADNDYRITVDDVDPNTGRIIEDGLTVDKNNAEFRSFGVAAEAGLRGELGLDQASVRLFYGDARKGLPHDLTQDIAFGEVETGQASLGGRLRVEDSEIFGFLDLDLVAGVVRRLARFTDLAETDYDFEGNPTIPGRGELVSGGVDQELTEWLATARVHLSAAVARDHVIALTLAPELERRTGVQRIPDAEEDNILPPTQLLSFVGGLSYRFEPAFFPVDNDLFAKLYVLDASGEEVVLGFGTGPFSLSSVDVGVGDAVVWRVFRELSVRASAEWATRLPAFEELFGDGVLRSANRAIEPERSLNLNLALSLSDLDTPLGRFGATAWGFGRITENLILIEAGQGRSRFVNVDSATIYGVEGELDWVSPGRYVQASAALTYEEGRNTSLEGELARFRDDRLPNRPYLYGSASLTAGVSHLTVRGDRVEARAAGRWVHEFFQLWPSAGDPDTKAVIPEQLVVDVGVVYRFPLPLEPRPVLAMSLESHNVLDARVFDQLGAERPGRSFHLKISGSYDGR
jgi:outer membrane receptor protein involved in Fe transport